MNTHIGLVTPCDSNAERSEVWGVHDDVGIGHRPATPSTAANPVATLSRRAETVAIRAQGAEPVETWSTGAGPIVMLRGGVS